MDQVPETPQPPATLQPPEDTVVSEERRKQIQEELGAYSGRVSDAKLKDREEEQRTLPRRTALGILGGVIASLLTGKVLETGNKQTTQQLQDKARAAIDLPSPDRSQRRASPSPVPVGTRSSQAGPMGGIPATPTQIPAQPTETLPTLTPTPTPEKNS